MTSSLNEGFERSARITRVAGTAIVVIMAFCVGVVFDAFAGRLSPVWSQGFLPWASAAVAIVGVISESQVHRLSLLSGERFSYRISEAIVIILSLKAGYFIHSGGEVFLAEISRYGTELWAAFFSGSFIGLALLSFIAWGFTVRMAGHLIDLSVDSEILEEGARPSMTTDRYEIRSQMAGGVLFFGAVLIVIAALTRADMRGLWGEAPVVASGAAGAIVYFSLAMVLFSLNQFSVLRGRWGWERTPIREGISRSWLKYTAAAITIVLAIAALLPTGYSLSLFESLAVVLQLLYVLMAYLVYLLVLPLLLLVAALNREPVSEFENPLGDLEPPPPVQPGEVVAGADPALWLEAARSLLFWAAFLGIALYAVVQFARHNEVLWQQLKAVPILRHLIDSWHAIRRWFSGVVQDAAGLVQTGLERIRQSASEAQGSQAWEFLGINRLSTRERVLFLYRAFERRAGEAHSERTPAQTPAEFAETLGRGFPDSAADIRGMTAAFETARYTRQEIRPEEVAEMTARWHRVRAALRGDRR